MLLPAEHPPDSFAREPSLLTPFDEPPQEQRYLLLQSHGSVLMEQWPTHEPGREPWAALTDQSQQANRAALGRWPLPQLQVELCEARASDEVALLEALASRGRLP